MEFPGETLTHGDVTLRRWHAVDAPLVTHAVQESLEHLAPWMPFAQNGYSLADGEAFLTRCVTGRDGGQNFNYAIVAPDGAVAGSCGLMTRPQDGIEIGYWLHGEYTGRGLATMAASALLSEAWRIGAAYVEIVHDEANLRSGAVPARLGFLEVARGPADVEATGARTGIQVVWRIERP
jgi:ribosomal-protein-serine acetyltransferase